MHHQKLVTHITVLIFVVATITTVSGDRFQKAKNRTFEGLEKDRNSVWKTNFTFIQGTDPQFGLVAAAASGNSSDLGQTWTEELSSLRSAIDQWNALTPAPAFVVLTGDLANAFPSRDPPLRRRQLNDLRTELARLREDIPLVLLSGNHDIEDSPTAESITAYTDEFGDDYLSFAYGGVLFLVPNTQLFKNHSNVEQLYQSHKDWLLQEISEAGQKNYTHRVVLQHIPWFLDNITEPTNAVFTIPLEERKPILEPLYSAGFRHIFAGHLHQNAAGKYNDLEMVTTSAIGWQNNIDSLPLTKPGYRIVRVTPEGITHEYVQIASSNAFHLLVPTRVYVFLCLAFASALVYLIG